MGKFNLLHISNPTNGSVQSENQLTDHSSGYQQANPSTQLSGDPDVFVIRYPESLKNMVETIVDWILILIMMAMVCGVMAVINIFVLIVEFGVYANLRGQEIQLPLLPQNAQLPLLPQEAHLLLLSEYPIIPYGTLIGLSVLYFIYLLMLTDIIRLEPS